MKGYSEEYVKLLEEIKQQQSKLFWQTENAVTVIKQYLIDTNIRLNNYSTDEAAEKLYNDIFNYSVLTNPLKDIWVQSIQINAWNEVYVHFINGKSVQIDGFNSPAHAEAVIKSLLKESNLDISKPFISAKIKDGIRLTAFFTPIVKEDVTVCCTIHKLKRREFTSQDYVLNDFAAKKELDFLLTVLNYGVSVLVAGGRESGKTTFMQYLLSSIQDRNIVTIEQTDRELSAGTSLLIPHNIDTKDFTYNILSLSPDIIGCDIESSCIEDISLNGCTVLASMFAGNAETALRQSAVQFNKYNDIPYTEALLLSYSAFPIVVTLHKYKDKPRISNILECVINNGNMYLNTLWEYQYVDENHGIHQQINDVSDSLINKMKVYGIHSEEINKFKKEEINYAGS